MASAILDATNVDTSVFSYSAPKANPSGGKVVNLFNKNFRESLTLALPMMLTWGAQEVLEQSTKRATGKFTMSLQFPNPDYANADTDACLASMRAVETKIKEDARMYCKEWFGRAGMSQELVNDKFMPMLKYPKKEKGGVEVDESKPPTLTVKLPLWSGVWQSEIYDEEGNPLFVKGKTDAGVTPLDFLKSKTLVICLIQCGGIWFVGNNVSITWNLKQAIVQKPKTSSIPAGVCFLKPKEADVQRLKTAPPPEDDIVDPDGGAVSALVEDSDEDDEEEEMVLPPPKAQTPPPVPAPVPVPASVPVEEPKKKKVISKKKPE
jgi:hypothetical protein